MFKTKKAAARTKGLILQKELRWSKENAKRMAKELEGPTLKPITPKKLTKPRKYAGKWKVDLTAGLGPLNYPK